MSVTSTWTVTGMTCEHCVASVTEELEEVAGVESVSVALDSGEVVVTSADELARDAVAAAVDEAGYTLV
ncbi:heavy-metal-associated domain-containing protein [Nocardioides acrostichi]|uniref:Heavy-metal-associated domain-containing protein n=1 Tax=Nocardioides acrostichi TaxID=2784339 RepID=A0A930V2G3_9ACTN|nr:cation transporter [Nocardioides acrostichi]MBF4162572.1 heavy-metal-associated domain-containing protein [Nocardioides acrostichi]